MNKLSYNLTALAILLTPFSDFPLRNTFLGFLGSSVSFIPLFLLIILHILRFSFNKKSLKWYFMPLFIFSTLDFLYGLIIYGLNFWNINLLDKGFRLSILILLFLIPLELRLDDKIIDFAFFSGLFILIGGVFWIDFLNHQNFLHASINANMRPRSFTLESSNFSIVLIALSTVVIDKVKKFTLKTSLIILSISVLIYSGSKGGLGVLVQGFVLLFLFQSFYFLTRNRLSKIIIYLSPILLLTCFGLISLTQRVLDSLARDVLEYSSTATRATLTLSTLYTVIQNPLGVGTTGFLPALVQNITPSIDLLKRYSPFQLNFDEVQSYVGNQSDQNISTKSFFLDGALYFGLPFIITYFYLSIFILNKLFKMRLWVLFVGSASLLLGLITFSGGLGLYAISFAIGWAIYRTKNINSEKQMTEEILTYKGLGLTK